MVGRFAKSPSYPAYPVWLPEFLRREFDPFGRASPDKTLNGCPNPDRDGDTYDDPVDHCLDQPETFNSQQDENGCPDAEQRNVKPLARWDVRVVDGVVRPR